MPLFSGQVISLFSEGKAAEQGGLLTGKDPTAFNAADPLRLWIIQVGIIVCTASLLSLGLSKMRQPKVIAEVLGGIILGPSAFGRVPGFTEHIFPPSSRPYLSLVANIGLCLFLFLVGLEIDAGVIRRNARPSAIVALAGMLLPFAMGAALSHAVYRQFIDPEIEFTHFMLFAGVAYSITAFPVLCRILTELKLLDTTVGIVVLSAGVGNDIVGWVLLALSVALVNAGSGLTALYILLTCVGWTLFLLFPVKVALNWLARITGSIQNGPSVLFMTVTMLILFGSAFFTDFIGVHAIFGAFVAGVIVPREGGLAISMTEKLEDMVSIIFLPLYFTLSGLSTNLGLLDDGVTWAYAIAIVATAFVGKFGGCMLAARYMAGFNWREASTIGSLMSCKGLVELIVLNVGLSAGILSQRVFSMFVLEALVLTFLTTPLVSYLYPPHLRRRIADTGADFIYIADDSETTLQNPDYKHNGAFKTRFTVVLDKFEHLPGMMALMRLIQPMSPAYEKRLSAIPEVGSPPGSAGKGRGLPEFITTEALRLIELSDRVSAVMKGSVPGSLLLSDPVLSTFRMFGQLSGISVSPSLSVAKFGDLAGSVADHARNFESDMVLVPWLPPLLVDGVEHHHFKSQVHSPVFPATPGEPSREPSREPPPAPPPVADVQTFLSGTKNLATSHNPFDKLFKSSGVKSSGLYSGHATPGGGGGGADVSNSAAIRHSQFVRGIFAKTKTDVALFVDQGTLDPTSSSSSFVGSPVPMGGMSNGLGMADHVFLPFFGGPDDRLALEFVVQLCSNPGMRGTVLRITKTDGVVSPGGVEDIEVPPLVYLGEEGRSFEDLPNAFSAASTTDDLPDTFYSQDHAETRLQSETADNIMWTRYTPNATPAVSAVNLNANPEGHLSRSSSSSTSSATVSPSHPRIVFKTISTPVPLHAAIQAASEAALSSTITTSVPSSPYLPKAGASKLVVVTGRSRRLAVEDHRKELKALMDEYGQVGLEVRKTIGDVATAFVVRGVGSGLVVLQAAEGGGVS